MANVTARTEEQKKVIERPPELTPFERMKALTRKIIAVPKNEIIKKQKRKRMPKRQF